MLTYSAQYPILGLMSIRGKQEMEKRKAPWKDFKGNDIYEGDLIKHPNGMVGGYVFFIPYFKVQRVAPSKRFFELIYFAGL